jgi:hypothetical protein
MSITRTLFGALCGLGLLAATPALAQQSQGNVRVGSLKCDVAAGVSFVFGSTRNVTCVFSPPQGASERYTGEIRRFGVDIGFTNASVMLWGVLASTTTLQPGALGGTFVGAAAGATVGVGGSANVLVGGSNQGVTLQPLSIEGSTGLNIAAGVGELRLELAK